jgi:hypothetical protein
MPADAHPAPEILLGCPDKQVVYVLSLLEMLIERLTASAIAIQAGQGDGCPADGFRAACSKVRNWASRASRP